jgi:hypothetical protein
MIGLSLSVTPSELGVALGIAFTDRLGAVANAIIANPIKTMRLTGVSSCFLGAGFSQNYCATTIGRTRFKTVAEILVSKKGTRKASCGSRRERVQPDRFLPALQQSRLIRELAPARGRPERCDAPFDA